VHDFADYLQRRWAEGCHNATKLFQEIRSQGYRGQRSMVAKFVSVWRRRASLSRPDRSQRFAPKQVTILATKSPDRLSDEQRVLLEKLSITCPELPSIRALALEFREALASKNSRQMLRWIQNAKQCGIGSMVRFAFGLQKDLAAVLAAVETPWSNGQVEGQVNRLKTLKRQMYGRAGFSLLRARVLPYAPTRRLPFKEHHELHQKSGRTRFRVPKSVLLENGSPAPPLSIVDAAH